MKHTNPAVFPIHSFVLVQFSCSVVSDSLWPHGMQHARFPCPSLTCSLLKLMSIESPHPLLSPSPAFSLSQLQGLFQWVSSSHPVAKVLELQFQHQSFQWIFRVDFLQDWLVWSPCFFCLHMSFLMYTMLECLSTHPKSTDLCERHSGNENHYFMERLAYSTSLQN